MPGCWRNGHAGGSRITGLTTFEEIEAHAGNRDFERVNALVCIGWGQTSSAAVTPEPAAEMDISDDGSHIWCNWTAGSLHSDIYEFYGSGQVVNNRTMSEADVTSLAGGLEVALDAIQKMVDIDRDVLLGAILQELEKNDG